MIVTLLLAAAWVGLTGELTLVNAIFGLALGFALGRLTGTRGLPARSLLRLPQALALAAFFLWELILASARITALVLSRRPRLRTAVLAVPIELEHDWQITLLACLVTLTPGSISLDVSTDRRTLYVHLLDCADPERERAAIRTGFEDRIRRLAP